MREQHSLTQEELARKIGISRAALSHYETGKREPDFDTLNRIADFFHVTVDYLVGRTNSPEQIMDQDVREFVDRLELSDVDLLKQFSLTVDGKKLTPEEAKNFIAFVRAYRSMNP